MCFFNGHINELGNVNEKKLKKLAKKVLSHAHLWDEEDKKKPNKFECFKTTRHIIFQYPVDLSDHTKSKYLPLWKDWKSLLKPIINEVTRSYNFKQGKTARIMLANIMPGGVIGKHIDQNASADVPHKIHVPLQTDKLAKFYEEDSSYYLEYGYAYEVNNKILHGVKNESNNERIHLIFDYYEAGK